MEKVVANILDALRKAESLDAAEIDRIIRARSAEAHDGRRLFAKKRILPFYLNARAEAGDIWRTWNVDDDLDRRFVAALQMKPRRTASGVATVTVLTKPAPCENSCVYCPNDPAMPKSYLSDEPACQRAERCGFDPYRQVAARLRALEQMGHATDKVELIVLGGTWLDYPRDYRTWFISELFRALNDPDVTSREMNGAESEGLLLSTGDGTPNRVDRSIDRRFSTARRESSAMERSTRFGVPPAQGSINDDGATCEQPSLEALHSANETAAHRCVGLVVETRPDTITPETLRELRALGCTKVQIGVQSIDADILEANGRRETPEVIADAFTLLRLFGFKIHAHFMVNLLGATPESDARDYRAFAHDARFMPDEVKLYPCALVASAPLARLHEKGAWRPYTEDELLGVLGRQLADTPPFTRISRMVRDISANDILVGNKKTNLRQLVEQLVEASGVDVHEIRFREIGTEEVDIESLAIDEVAYATRDADERFLQWVTPTGKIAGFLRLSLPHAGALERFGALPVKAGEAMIREVHVYGFATRIEDQGQSAQHRGLGRALVERACEIARDAGYARVNVISAVGTREYYRGLGFRDNGLYQQRALRNHA